VAGLVSGRQIQADLHPSDSATFRLGAKLVCAIVWHSPFGPKVVEAIGEKAFSSAVFVV
jgi:hypothetical protein